MMNDAAIEAQEAAARELSKLLPSPELLANISSVRADYAARQQANDAQLSTSVTTQVEHARAGIEALTKSQATIATLRQNFVTIERLCAECDTLIENHDQIQLLSIVRNNLNTTLKDVEGMLSISVEAEKARQSLSETKELIKTYEQLTALEGKRRFALAAAAYRPEEAGKLSDYFENVDKTKEIFEQTLWGYIRDYLSLSQQNPQTLVRALRVVEMQEIMDEEAREEMMERQKVQQHSSSKMAAMARLQGGLSSSSASAMAEEAEDREERDLNEALSGVRQLKYKDIAYEQIELAAQNRFKNLLSNLVNDDMGVALEEATAISQEIGDVYDYAAPCFPPRYEVFQYVVQLYTRNFVEMLQKFGDRAEDISNTDILKLMAWLNDFEEDMIKLGVEESVATTPAESGALEPLIEEYVKRMSSTMRTWLTNLLEIDKQPNNLPKPRPEDGRLYTPVAIDVFRLLGEQIQIVQEHRNGLMLFKAAEANLQVIFDFQDLERQRLKDPVIDIGWEKLCAMVNNNVRCHELAMELANSIVDSLEPKYSNQLQFTDAVNGFLEVAKEAAQQTVEYIFADNGVRDLVAKLYKKEWLEGDVTESLIATFEDYYTDIKNSMEERSFRRFTEACLERTLVTFIDGLLSLREYVSDRTIERMAMDEEFLEQFFKESISAKRLKERLSALSDLRDIMSSDNAEAFTFSYSKLLSQHPDCPPLLVEKLVGLREGIPKKEAREVVQECQEVYNTAVQAKGVPAPGIIFSKLQALKKKESILGSFHL